MTGIMHDLRTLLRLRTRLLLRSGISGRGGAKKPRTRLPARYIIFLLAAGFLTYSVESLLSGVVSAPLGKLLLTPLLISLSSITMLSLFLLAIPMVVAALTYDSDLRLLLMTPLSTRLIMAEKLLVSCGQFILLLVTIGTIILVGVGRALGLGLAYDLTAVVILLLLPIVPVSSAFMLAVLLLRWVPPARARTITTVFGGLLGLIIYIGIQMLFRRPGQNGSDDQLRALLTDTSGTWWSSLPTTWPGRALAEVGLGHLGSGLTYLAATLLLALLLAGVTVLLSARLFATGWATYQEVGRRARPRPAAAGAGTGASSVPVEAVAARSLARSATRNRPIPLAPISVAAPAGRDAPDRSVPWRPLLRKEWLVLRRDPTVWSRLLFPFLIVGFGFYQAFTQMPSDTMPGSSAVPTYVLCGVLAYTAFFLLLLIAQPMINREGRALYLLALAPLRPVDILRVKWAFCAVPVLILIEVLLGVGTLFLHVPLARAGLAALAFASLVVALTGALLLINLIWPRLDWDNPRQQVSTTAGLVGMIGGLILAAGTCLLLILSFVWSADHFFRSILATGGIFVVTGLVIIIVERLAPRRLELLLHRGE